MYVTLKLLTSEAIESLSGVRLRVFGTAIGPILKRYQAVFGLIAALTVFRLIYILFIPLTPQEAYYWYYSLHPDWSYFDHPPLAAWSIWIGTALFGKSVFGIKVMAVVWGALTNVMIVGIVLQGSRGLTLSVRRKLALGAIGLFNLTVFAHLYSILMVPDSPLLFFWALSLFLVQRYLGNGHRGTFLLAGVALGLALLSKYTAAALVPAVFWAILSDPVRRRDLGQFFPYLALLLAAAVFAPVLYWNASHDWASFGFQFVRRSAKMKPPGLKYLGQLLISQLFILTPFVMILLAGAVRRVVSMRNRMPRGNFLLASAAVIILPFFGYSFFGLVKMNWLLPGYLGLLVLTCRLWAGEMGDGNWLRGRGMKVGLWSSVILIVLAHLILVIPDVPLGEGNTWSGWQRAARSVDLLLEAENAPEQTFVFTNSYKASSMLRFYLPHPREVYSGNIFGEPALQFDIWGIPDSLTGQNAIYVCDNRREYKNKLPE
nr:glycosyltransferase family 39 protein [Calditrichia bacterium]